jgi:transposase
MAELSAWRDEFVENGTQGFKKKPDDSKLAHAERRIGQLEMELDLVKKKNALVVKLKR